MYNEQDHIRHQEERTDQDLIDAHENWLISEEVQEMDNNDSFEVLRDRFIKHYENVI